MQKVISLEVRVESTEWRVQSGGYRVEGTEWRVQSGEYRVESTGWRVQSTEWRHLQLSCQLVSFNNFTDFACCYLKKH